MKTGNSLKLFLLITLFTVFTVNIFAAPAINGVSYILLSKDFSDPYSGVYRLHDYSGTAEKERLLFSLNNMGAVDAKISGLAVSQEDKKIYLLSSPTGGSGDWETTRIGWLPTGMTIPDDSPIYMDAVNPTEGDMTNYKRVGQPHLPFGRGAYQGGYGPFWYTDFVIGNKTYDYGVRFGSRELDGLKMVTLADGSTFHGVPIWNGKYTTSVDAGAGAAIKHPSDDRKIILPSQFGAISYWVYGEINDVLLDGKGGSPRREWSDGKAGHEPGYGSLSGETNSEIFTAILKRIYKTREKSLDLYSAVDNGSSVRPGLESSGVLTTKDVKVEQFVGKYCGDACIPGGSVNSADIGSFLSSVDVITSSRGIRYGFNQRGERISITDSIGDAFRVVKNGNTTSYALANPDGTFNTSVISNASYLDNIGVTPLTIAKLGVSSDFSGGRNGGIDYVYGSAADLFVIQDSWWGKGGVAYEYYRSDKGLISAGTLRKLDYFSSDYPIKTDIYGLDTDVDDIDVDGEGALYVLKSIKCADSEVDITGNIEDLRPGQTIIADDVVVISVCTETDSSQITDYTHYHIISGAEGQSERVECNNDPDDCSNVSSKDIVLGQAVRKEVIKYGMAKDSLDFLEKCGSVLAGYDQWHRTAEYDKSQKKWFWPSLSIWTIAPDAELPSSEKAELAVVNMAIPPAAVSADNAYFEIISKGESNGTFIPNGNVVSENEHVSFEIKGYRDFINSGKSVNAFNPTKVIKLNFNANGEYPYFPSSMFEGGSASTTVVYTIQRKFDIDAASIITEWRPESSSAVATSPLLFGYTFKDPGEYLVTADVTYHYFTNYSTSGRPENLTSASTMRKSISYPVSVYSERMNINNTDSYVENVYMGIPDKSNNGSYKSEPVEFSEDGTLDPLEISFDIAFVHNINTSLVSDDNDFGGENGAGVWDYSAYKQLYEKSGMNIAPISISPTGNVYNWKLNSDSPAEMHNPLVYNPGWLMHNASGKSSKYGTEVDMTTGKSKIKPNDWHFVQWGLYLRSSLPGVVDNINYGAGTIPRGELIATGNLDNSPSSASFTRGIPTPNTTYEVKRVLNNNSYGVTITLPSISSLIHTPRDGETYTLDLEIIYPRVFWAANDLDKNSPAGKDKIFYSLVPTYENSGSPIHLISNLSSADANFKNVNISNGSSVINKSSVEIRALDTSPPELSDLSVYSSAQGRPIIHTTGDSFASATVVFTVSDNNPFARIPSKIASFTEDDIKTEFKIVCQSLYENKRFNVITDSNRDNKVYSGPNAIEISPDEVSVSQTSSDKLYFEADDWRVTAIATSTFDTYVQADFKPSHDGSGDTLAELETLKMENWIGKLSYSITGSIYDGIGTTSSNLKNLIHQWYIAESSGTPPRGGILAPEVLLVERFDNDPPSIVVDLVSQVDNRVWKFILKEGINDSDGCFTNASALAESQLLIASGTMKSTSFISFSKKAYPGVASYPAAVALQCAALVEVESTIVPQFRRASRLLINFNAYDNTGFNPLQAAWIKVTDGNSSLLSSSEINLEASHDNLGNLIRFEPGKAPRGSFVVDMPMTVTENTNQIMIEVMAEDLNHNYRILRIPVKIVESSFETRVLETKETRK